MTTLRNVDEELLPELSEFGHVMTSAQAASVLGVNRQHLVVLMRAGRFPGFRVGGTWKVRRGDVQDVMQGRWTPPPGGPEDDGSS